MQITLNIHSTLAKFYRAFWNKTELPNNLCSYFWSLLIAFVFLPFTFPAVILNEILIPFYYSEHKKKYEIKENRINTAMGILFNFLFWAAGLTSMQIFYGDEILLFIPLWKFYINGIIVFAGMGLFFSEFFVV